MSAPCPFDYDAFADEHGHFSPGQMGFSVHLTLAIWSSEGRSLPFDYGALCAQFGRLDSDEFQDVMDCAFWVDDRSRRVHSPWVQRWLGAPEARRPIPAEIKEMVRFRDMWRDRLTCAYCQAECTWNHHFDHMLPISRGGLNHHNNLAIACPSCNRRKATMTSDEFWDLLHEEEGAA